MKSRIAVTALVASLAALPALAQQAAPSPDPAGQAGAARAEGPMRGPGRMGGGAMLRMADANGDGVVTRAEYTAAVDARFARMDINHDGMLSADEMPMRGGWRGGRAGADAPPPPPPSNLSPTATGTPPAPPPSPAAGRAPETRDQYRAAAMRRFDRLDTNHDGRIDQGEMAAMAQMRPPRGAMGDAPPPADQ